jgi:Mrp family chromosome partitioning ATPase
VKLSRRLCWSLAFLTIALIQLPLCGHAQEEDPVVLSLRKEIAGCEQRLSEYSVQLTEEHPRVQQLRQRILAINEQLNERLRNLPPSRPVVGSSVLPEPSVLRQPPAEKLTTGKTTEKVRARNPEPRHAPSHRAIAAIAVPGMPAAEPLPSAPRTTESNKSQRAANPRTTSGASPVPSGVPFPTLALGLLVLFALGVTRFFRKQSTDNRARHVDEIAEVLPFPIVGWINQSPVPRRSGEILPGIHRLRTFLRSKIDNSGKRLIVTSPDAGDGKSIMSSALAINLAETGLSVALVDANLQNPSAEKTFFLCDQLGLGDYLQNPEVTAGLISHQVKHNLQVIPAGNSAGYSNILHTKRFAELQEELARSFDVVIYDCPSVSETSDALGFAPSGSYHLVVARLGHSDLNSVKLLAAQLMQSRLTDVGVVLFGADERSAVNAHHIQYQTHLRYNH